MSHVGPRRTRPCRRAREVAATVAAACALPLGVADAQNRAPVGPRVTRADTAGQGLVAAAARDDVRATVRDVGPGIAGRLLRGVIAAPHRLVVAPDTGITLGRDVRVDRPLVVIGGPTRVAATVRGDLVVLGDLFLRPGAVIDGRAVAIGGGVYNSTLAVVRGGRLAYRDLGFEATPEDGRPLAESRAIALAVRDAERTPVRLVSLPGTVGLRLPNYTRVDGLTVTFGPEIAIDTGRVRVEPLVTYRSHLGAVDPGLRAFAQLGRRSLVEVRAERGTFTNDAWIRNDIINAATVLASGVDTRNYFRADRAELTAARRWETETATVEPYLGGLVERAWSAPRDSAARSAPFSAFGRRDREAMLRPNPAVTGGRIASAIAGARARVDAGGVGAAATVRVEQALSVARASRFTQATLGGELAFPAFRDHRFEAFAHVVVTAGDTVPAQRYAYLGGQGTLPTLPLLSQGGDRLFWAESRYTVPLDGVRLPLVGAPSVTLRHLLGAAGVDAIPTLTQNLGLRVTAGFVRVDYAIDPATGRSDVGVGLGLLR